MDRYKTKAVPRLIIAGVLFSLYILITPAGQPEKVLGLAIIGVSCYSLLLCAYFILPTYRYYLPTLTWTVMWAQILVGCIYRHESAYNELLGWVLLTQFLTLCTVPQNRFTLIICSITPAIYIGIQFANCYKSEPFSKDFFNQMLVNITLLSAVTFIGISAYRTWNRKVNTLYDQVAHTLSIKKAMEKQAMEEERLVLSVLPEHVAVQMRDNLGRIDKQFKKIYMSRHENVSILYADIVGFTAISSTYSAQDLVAILNELFARFDRLAEKYEQLRIKILGDCYYCISGAPVERDDHAALCVYMGLSMVKAIKYVQQTTNSPVDMRVGIHTGAVLAGVLGQRQWQFDVYSRDVELANKMESSGMAGRVHISEVTLSYLNGEFEVEPAYGERREEMLRQAGIKTYFITRVIKPHNTDETDDVDMTTEDNSTKDEDEERAMEQLILNSDQETSSGRPFTKEEFDDLYNNLQIDQMDNIRKLTFKNVSLEYVYVDQFEPAPIVSTYLPFVLMPAFLALSTFIVPVAWTLIFFCLSFSCSLVCHCYWRFFAPTKLSIPANMTTFVLIFVIVFLELTNFSTLLTCGIYEMRANKIYTTIDEPYINSTIDEPYNATATCYYASYYYHIGVVAYCATFWIPARLAAISLTVTIIWLFNVVPGLIMYTFLDPSQRMYSQNFLDYYKNTTQARFFRKWDADKDIMIAELILYDNRHVLMLLFTGIAFLSFMQLYEREDRTRFCRQRMLVCENLNDREKKNRNQTMVNNVLPPHVAKHFMGGQHNHRDLYSQSYSEVGVLFASMPNFTEFYSEESVNNQGLECLRFLNEVISDFDMLLDDKYFRHDIVKIKTISSTYMAASGLGPKDKLKTSNSVIVKWDHLSRLVVFALELQRTLAAINEQSFNHFVLRLGINHGPITAGVIGARKPHYDIWGNTVNVASRMESTGKAGCIQVTSETAKILREFGYQFEQRGLVAVKGKGELMTYYLLDKDRPAPPRPTEVSPIL